MDPSVAREKSLDPNLPSLSSVALAPSCTSPPGCVCTAAADATVAARRKTAAIIVFPTAIIPNKRYPGRRRKRVAAAASEGKMEDSRAIASPWTPFNLKRIG
jgi:hypothetical protein